MGAIQNSINTALTIGAGAAAAVDRSSYLANKVALAENEVPEIRNDIATEMAEGEKALGNKQLQAALAKMEVSNPSAGSVKNESPGILRRTQATRADEEVAAAQKALSNLEKSQRLKTAILDSFNLRKGSIIGAIKNSKAVLGLSASTYQDELNKVREDK